MLQNAGSPSSIFGALRPDPVPLPVNLCIVVLIQPVTALLRSGEMQKSEIRFRVRYAETDQMGIVYHANYLVWMEMGRVEMCRQLGVRYRDMEESDGVLLTVAEAQCRFISPARYDDEILVRTTVARTTTRILEFAYDVVEAESNRLLARGSTKHVYCGRDLRPCKLPEKYWPAFGLTRTQIAPSA